MTLLLGLITCVISDVVGHYWYFDWYCNGTFYLGTYVTKFVVRRIPVYKDRKSKLLRLGHTSLKFKFHKDSEIVSGYRLINIDNLKEHIVEITTHSCLCAKAQELVSKGKDPLTLKSEINRCGLFSVLMVLCNGCNQKFPLKNSKMIESGLYDINIRAVWGTVATGGGPSDLNETLGTMNVPMMSDTMFTALEQKIGLWWNDMLKDEMAKAGAEEKRIAVEKESFHEGVPAISVICDGGWSKRTHKHTYNAYGGVAVIFGAETQKLLYIGVRNKHCSVCRLAKNQGVDPKNHNCFANWKESSQAMEADIILSGFLEAESTHGVRYLKIIADGDSSVFATLQEKVPVWGKDIKKLECANHVCKCVRSNLEKLVLEKPQYKGKGKLTKYNRVRLTTALRCAIKMRSKTNNARQLRKDILNSIYHVLGFHDKCSDFCKKRPHKKLPQDDSEDDAETDDNSVDSIFDNQSEYWKSPSERELENSRLADKSTCRLSELQELINDVLVILNKVADKSDRLLGNFTTNLAESWMAIRAKFDGGKVINRCNRGSWNTRCYGGALRKNLGSAWSPLTFQTATQTEAGIYFHQLARRQTQQLVSSKKYKAKPESKDIRRKRKLNDLKETTSKKAKIAYGSNLDDTPDVSKEKLAELCAAFLNKNIRKNEDEIQAIENASVEQCNSDIWKKERHIRLTSSNFGKIMSRRLNNVSTSLAQRMLYSKFKGNIHTIRGLAQEKHTIIEYENKYNVQVKTTGFRICKLYPSLGASTDGLVHDKTTENEHGLLEIKNFLQTNTLLIKDAARKIKNFCLEERQNKLHLKTSHEIYYQIQGQLNIFEKEWCDFVLRRTNPYDIHVERIYKDSSLWENEMVPKLEQFYQKFLLPELALPRYGTYSGIRKPAAPWVSY